MKLNQLRYLIQIVRSGSINRAAQALYISQPTLSKTVEDLEAEMGIVIFTRTSRGVTLTEDGMRFLSYARQVVEQAACTKAERPSGACSPYRRSTTPSS